MGWLFMSVAGMGTTRTPKSYLDAQLTYERTQDDGSIVGFRVLRSACVSNRVYYAAAQPYERRDGKESAKDAVAIVCLIRWNPRAKSGEHFGYKDMDENMGPYEDHCPESVLVLLGSTNSESAIDWRRRCLGNLALRKRPIADGMMIKLASPITFTDEYVGDEFTVHLRGRKLIFVAPTGGRYTISRFRTREWTVIPQTKVHAPIFAKRV
jgi:hypothetical protein